MEKKDGLHELDDVDASKTAEEKQHGGRVRETGKAASHTENGESVTNLIAIELSKPQGCSQTFADVDGESS